MFSYENADLIGLEHFNVAERCVQHMQKNNALSDIISILGKTMPCAPRFHLKKFLFFCWGIDELSEDDKNIVYRSKKSLRIEVYITGTNNIGY